MANHKVKILRHNNHKVASLALSDVKGPYIRADGTWFYAIAERYASITKDTQKPITHIRMSLGQDGDAAKWGDLPAERMRRGGEFELNQTKGDEEEAEGSRTRDATLERNAKFG